MVSVKVEIIFMHEPPFQVEDEIGFDFTAPPFFTSSMMEICQNMLEIKMNETIPLLGSVCNRKISNHLPQLGLEEILFYHHHYAKGINELAALEERTVRQNCKSGGLKKDTIEKIIYMNF
ncbi:hypothetical protein TNCT_7091 [Trichonephila clavata]|uniref:Uncharacterized protein n=1 Tax=Trichonephila clavata TaxID=2740835 RepID=A0A8X6GX74_TRICU|nr:hypothetical protein TNCT_7091 [Trichonephila clavata]